MADIPQADYGSVWPELVGWVQAAQEGGEQIDPTQLLEYMRELKRRALTPVRQWMTEIAPKPNRTCGHSARCKCMRCCGSSIHQWCSEGGT